MGILKDVADSVIHYGEMLVTKTEEYTRIARLNLDIRRLSGNVDDIANEIGRYVIEQADTGAGTVETANPYIRDRIGRIKIIEKDIAAKRAEIEAIKSRPNPGAPSAT